MINTPWESRVWHLDMQLIGKVALSATAVFILALAYRFYKLRKLESTGPNGNHVPCSVTEKNPTEEAPLRDNIGEEIGNLRFRCVHNNLQNSSVTDHGNKNPANQTHLKAQERLSFGDVTQKDQSGLTSEQLHKKPDPLLSLQQTRHDTAGQTDECDGEEVINKTQSQDCRHDPEGGEMQEKSEMANYSSGKESEDWSASHENRAEENSPQVISTEMQGDIFTDGGQTQTLTTGGLGEKMVESSSQPFIDEVDHRLDTEVHENQIPPTDVQPSTEKGDISITVQQEPTNDDDCTKDNIQEEMSKIQNLKDNQEEEEEEDKETTNGTQTQRNQSNIISSVTASSSLLNQQDQDSARVVQSAPNTYHISLDKESTLDIHPDLGNCYEVLCLAKKYNHDALIAAAYKIMSDNYLQVLQNPTIYGRLNAMERDLILEARMKGRRFVVVADIDTQATNAPENSSSLSYYDSDNDQWHSLSHIPSEAVSRGCSMATLFNYIFIVLGSDGLERQMKPSKRVLCYNPSTGTWKEVASLKEARPHCKLVALDGCLYAIGGECLHTVEKYDPRQNKWSYIAPLPNDTFAVAHMATAYDDEIYVTGGTIRYMLLRYNHREKIWKNSHISGSKDRTTEIVIANNFLYRFDLNRSMGISVHRCNIRARIWYECATYAMPYPAPFQCVVIDNNIYCISRNFHLRFLADEVSPRFMDVDLQTVPLPKGILYPLVLVLPVKGVQ